MRTYALREDDPKIWFGLLYIFCVSPDNIAVGKTKTSLTVRRLMELIKVSSTSRTASVAGAIAGMIRDHQRAEVQAIGAGAVNQAIKAIAMATIYLKGDGILIGCVPEFADVTIEDKVRTAIKFLVEPSNKTV